MGRGSDGEVRLGKSRSAWFAAISGHFWVHFLGSWVCDGVVWWFAMMYSWVFGVVCSGKIGLFLAFSRVCLIIFQRGLNLFFFFFFLVGHLLDSEFAISLF